MKREYVEGADRSIDDIWKESSPATDIQKEIVRQRDDTGLRPRAQRRLLIGREFYEALCGHPLLTAELLDEMCIVVDKENR